MSADLLRDLMRAIPGGVLREVTIECAPGTVSAQTAASWVNCGVNRVSLGVQSFVAAEIERTGRRHTAETVASDIETLRRNKIENINIDLIAGLPRQTADSWRASLEWIDRLAPEHVSVYVFEMDDRSRLGKEALHGGDRYGADELPDDGATADLYSSAVERLAQLGYRRYEISNFARPGFESRHNLKYWRLEPYVGFGAGAHSFDGKKRWSNAEDLTTYMLGKGRRKAIDADLSEERFFIGLRLLDGIEPSEAEWTRFAAPVKKWVAAGMLERSGNNLRLSNDAVLLSNEIFQDFLCPA